MGTSFTARWRRRPPSPVAGDGAEEQAQDRGAAADGQAAVAAAAQRTIKELGAELQARCGQEAEAQRRYDATVQALTSRMQQAEEAAEQVLALHAAQVDMGGASPGKGVPGPDHARCRELITGLHAQVRAAGWCGVAMIKQHATLECTVACTLNPHQVWRERLARQRAQMQQHAEPGAAPGGGPIVPELAGAKVELDSWQQEQLEAEARDGEGLARSLSDARAHQRSLAQRVEQLDLQLGEYASLLAAAEAVAAEAPPLCPTRAGGSPVRQAITSLQLRRAEEQADALQRSLAGVEGELVELRRRERTAARSAVRLAAANKELGKQQAQLVAGLQALAAMLKQRPHSQAHGAGGGMVASSPRARVDCALALLSALLGSLHGPPEMLSPQLSEGVLRVEERVRSPSVLSGPAAAQRAEPAELPGVPAGTSPARAQAGSAAAASPAAAAAVGFTPACSCCGSAAVEGTIAAVVPAAAAKQSGATQRITVSTTFSVAALLPQPPPKLAHQSPLKPAPATAAPAPPRARRAARKLLWCQQRPQTISTGDMPLPTSKQRQAS